MTVDKGSVYGLVGYNGAGKTTLLKTVAGIYRADGGSVTVDGVDVFDSADVKRRMFYVPDDLYFNYNSSIEKMAKFYAGITPNSALRLSISSAGYSSSTRPQGSIRSQRECSARRR